MQTILAKKGTHQWRCLEDEQEYLQEKGKAIAARRSTFAITIGVEAELQASCGKLPGPSVEPAKHHIFNQTRAMDFLQQLEACRAGAAVHT